MLSGVVRECSFSKWFCRISMIWVGDAVMVFVVGSLRASSFGWFFALGCRPAVVLRLLWYRLGLFLYSWSSFFRRVLVSFLFALFMIAVMAWWQSVGIS